MTHDVMRTKAAIDAFTLARARQVVNHGFSSDDDDHYEGGELADAAACYALGEDYYHSGNPGTLWPWPWPLGWWKPSPDNEPQNRKRDIEKAGALLLAEWERLDRMQERRAEGDVT